MPFQLTAKTVGDLTTFFGTGYVFRQGLYFVRRGRQPSELHSIVLAVVTSLCLWSLFSIVSVPFLPVVPASSHAGLVVASRLAVSYFLGLGWGALPSVKWIRDHVPVFGSRRGQNIIGFLESARNHWVVICLTNDQEILGQVFEYDRDPERFNDYHLSVECVHRWVKGQGWVRRDVIESTLISGRDIRSLTILAPTKPKVAAKPNPPAKPSA